MNMKFKATLLGLSIAAVLPTMNMAQTPVYLDTSKPIEERVKDALSRMTLEEKVKMTHAQSKFSSPGVPRLGIPEVWATDGPHGIRPEVLWSPVCVTAAHDERPLQTTSPTQTAPRAWLSSSATSQVLLPL